MSGKPGIVVMGLWMLISLLTGCARAVASGPTAGAADAPASQQSQVVQAVVSAPYSTSSWDERDAQRAPFDLPLVYLHRQRAATPASERTLQIRVTGVPPLTHFQIELQSQHTDMSTGSQHTLTQRFTSPDRACSVTDPCTFQWTLDPASVASDLYRLRVQDTTGNLLWQGPHPDRPDFVALDTWDVPLGRHRVRVFYATLFPFARGPEDPTGQLSPQEVVTFIEGPFSSAVAETWYTQVEAWGFGAPLHADWDGDNTVEIIITTPPFALFDGTGTYTRSVRPDGRLYPERRIWWLASNNCFQTYDTLENGVKAVLAHEFFHLMQLNLRLMSGSLEKRWSNLLIEAQGKFVPTVQYPELELRRDHVSREGSEYANAANRFLTLRLNSSYRELEDDPTDKYDWALYWRFLYEQHGDMRVVRAALEEMARHAGPDVIGSLQQVMDNALARSDGPFADFQRSLIAFARANYALRLENGRCSTAEAGSCGGFYFDPQHIYVDPPLASQLRYDGHGLKEEGFVPSSSGTEFAPLEGAGGTAEAAPSYSGAIPSSYGMDFIEVRLDPELHGRPLVVRVASIGSVARFSVQVWQVAPGEIRPRAVTSRPELVPPNAANVHVYVLPTVDIAAYDRLALIITRLDPDERSDPVGGYCITLESDSAQ